MMPDLRPRNDIRMEALPSQDATAIPFYKERTRLKSHVLKGECQKSCSESIDEMEDMLLVQQYAILAPKQM